MYKTNYSSEDFLYILKHLRKPDKIEAKHAYGKRYIKKSVVDIESIKSDTFIGKSKITNKPILIWGTRLPDKCNPAIAIIWMLATSDIEKHQIKFLKEAKKEIAKIDDKYAITFNYIYKENLKAKNWLRWLGFRFPKEEKKLTFLDKVFLNFDAPKDYEIFYRERKVKGLGE